MNAAPLFASLLAVSFTLGCKVTIPKNKTVITTAATTAAVTIAAPTPDGVPPVMPAASAATVTAPGPAPTFVKEETLFRVPVGPALTILPGEGLGPIRFGAKLSTVQRLMEGECTELTERDGKQWCRYQPNAVDFGLQDDRLVEIHIHGMEREFIAGKGIGVDNIYGIFRGTFTNKAQLGMYPQFVEQGDPLRVEKVEPARFPTVEKHHYENMVLEYDKLQNGNVVLGGVVLTKPRKPLVTNAKEKTAAKSVKKRKPKPLH